MTEVTDENFKTEVESRQGLVLAKFGAVWCGPCRLVDPQMEELASEMEDRIKIVKLDIDKAPDTTAGLGIRSIPCLILFKDGKEVGRQVGARSKSDVKKWLESNPGGEGHAS